MGFDNTIDVADISIAFAGLAFAFAQFWFALRKEKFDSTMWLLDKFQDPSATEARFLVTSIMEDAEKKGHDFSKVSVPERAKLSSVGILFGLAGIMFRLDRIDRKLFLAAYGNSVFVNFQRLKPFMEWRDRDLGSRGTLWREFEEFAATCTSMRAKAARRAHPF